MYSEAETFLILKYGSIPKAYKAWQALTYLEQYQKFNTAEYTILMEYEYDMNVESGIGPFDPR